MDGSHSLPSASRPGARAEASHPFPPWRLTYRVGVGKASSVTTFDAARIFETLYRHGVDYVTIGTWAGLPTV